jgi:heme/copper-type cytochrome/quinol oxidase subunit 4
MAASVAIFGRTPFALRLPSAVIGTLTVIPFYLLTKSWFGRRTALFAITLWAITLWPIHLSRIGFRTIFLPFFLSIALYQLTRAIKPLSITDDRRPITDYRQPLLAGFTYALTFYTYLAARLTPLFLIIFSLYLYWRFSPSRSDILRIAKKFIIPFGSAFILTIAPLLITLFVQTGGFFGRSDQVSIFSPIINEGDFWGTLWRHLWRTIGMFVWRGDEIVRHNPAGRPVFDLLIAVPLLIGLVWSVRNFRRPAAAASLLFCGTMAWGTILAEDAPHFLRAVGMLPVLLIFPAIGLCWLSSWNKLHFGLHAAIPASLLLGSAVITVRDYRQYNEQPETAYLFEAAARELGEQIDAASELSQTAQNVSIDDRYLVGWAAIPFLVDVDVLAYRGAPDSVYDLPHTIFAWPYQSLDFIAEQLHPNSQVTVTVGALARGDLEPTAYPFYVQYAMTQMQGTGAALANFDNQLWLEAIAVERQDDTLAISLRWRGEYPLAQPLTAYVHVVDQVTGELIQSDMPPAGSFWSPAWWRENLSMIERRDIPVRYDPNRHAIFVGVYDSVTLNNLPVVDRNGLQIGERWEYQDK